MRSTIKSASPSQKLITMAATNGSFSQQEQYKSSTEQYTNTTSVAENASGNASGAAELSKDEIGWYFVEQYYTTLSKSPEKLHLFYGKRSQMVIGPEAEVAPISVGRAAIQERIKSLGFQDCKVRVSNVDSQSSDETIVIQVIGETSNKSADLKKFVQTFVLAQQPTGYFVLNDIFRYINEDVEEETAEATATEETAAPATEEIAEPVEMPKAQPAVEETKTPEIDTEVVEKKLEESSEPTVLKAAETNGDAEAAPVEAAAESPAAAPEKSVTPEAIEKELEEEDVKATEAPKDPEPTPALSRLPSTTSAPKPAPTPAAPAKPMSWANRAAAAAASAAHKVIPAVPAPKTASPGPAQARAAPAPAAAAAAPAPKAAEPAAPAASKEAEAPQSQGWQTAGADAKRQNRPQAVAEPAQKEGTMGYVRNVTEGVKAEDLRSALNNYGEVVYFDINRQKNCAFVEFATKAGYEAAFAANPHVVNGESIVVEARRPKTSAYGGAGYNSGRGGMNNRGRGGFENRGPGSQRGRGNFGGAPRGGAQRTRGPSTPAAV